MLHIDLQEYQVKWGLMERAYDEFIAYKKQHPLKPLVFFGAGAAGSIFYYNMKSQGIEITCFCDNDEAKQNTTFLGLDIFSYPDLKNHFEQYDMVLSDGYMIEKLEQLKNSGEQNPIFCIEKTISYNIGLSYEYFKEHEALFNQTYELLEDLKSRQDMRDFLLTSMTGDVGLFHGTNRKLTYFDESVFSLTADEVYADVGAYRGETILGFLDYCGNKYKRIFAVEADQSNFAHMRDFVREKEIANVHMFHAAAWNKKEVVQFDSWESALSRIDDANIEPPHKQIKVKKIAVDAIDLDSILFTEHPTYIKMDIEGAELKALEGVKQSIIKYKPKLAISVYHKKEDLIEIPVYIKSLVPEYQFYLRNYGAQGGDTVLYAVL